MPLPRRTRRFGDHFDESVLEQEAVGIERRGVGARRLSEPTQVADHRDRTHVVVVTLRAPRGDRGIVHRAVQREVELHVVLQTVDLGPVSADPQRPELREIVGGEVGDRVPVTGRCFRHRPVGPVLGDDAAVVAERDHVRFVGFAGDRVDLVSDRLVGAELTVALDGWRDVDRRRRRRIERRAVADHLVDRSFEVVVGRGVAEHRRRTWIAGQTVPVGRREGERRHASPVRPDEGLDGLLQRDPVLGLHHLEFERLPPIRIVHLRARSIDDQRRVDRRVVGGVAARLVRSVGEHRTRGSPRRCGCRTPPGCHRRSS